MKLTFPKSLGFARDPENDFEDDGNHFRMYKYKDVLSFSALHDYGEVFVSLRSPKDMNGNRVILWEREGRGYDKFNGISERSWNVNEFARYCEYICTKYNVLPVGNSNKPKALFELNDKNNINKMVGYYNNGSSLKRVISALRSPSSKDKFIDRYYISRYIQWGDINDWVDLATEVHEMTADDLIQINRKAIIDSEEDVYDILGKLKN